MKVEMITEYVVRLSRVEGLAALVDPKKLQEELRGVLYEQPNAGDGNGNGNGPSGKIKLLPAATGIVTGPVTRRAMRKLRAYSKRVPCPQCGRKCKPQGLKRHLVSHRDVGVLDAATTSY